MRILVVEPERRPQLREIDSSLRSMQEIVSGPIQTSYPFEDAVILVCNREGRSMDLPANRRLRDKDGRTYDIVCGTFLLCGVPDDSDHFTSLTTEQIERYQKIFYTPEMFSVMDGHIVCQPLEVD